jgi:hypothetical protein
MDRNQSSREFGIRGTTIGAARPIGNAQNEPRSSADSIARRSAAVRATG